MKQSQEANDKAVRELNAKRMEANAIKDEGEASKAELTALRQRKVCHCSLYSLLPSVLTLYLRKK
jgi:hypothetical protein